MKQLMMNMIKTVAIWFGAMITIFVLIAFAMAFYSIKSDIDAKHQAPNQLQSQRYPETDDVAEIARRIEAEMKRNGDL